VQSGQEFSEEPSDEQTRSSMNGDNEPATVEELVQAQAIALDAVLRVLEQKGILTKNEVLAEIVKIRRELSDKAKRN
jgi:hypothetical protein